MSIKALQDYTFYAKYAKHIPDKKRRETWQETVDRVFSMHETKFADVLATNEEFKKEFYFAKEQVFKKRVLGSQRALQFGGDPIFQHETKIYNCSFGLIDRSRAFQEFEYLLLCGVGVGFSVQPEHINKLPTIKLKSKGNKKFVIRDSIEGWADAVGVLVCSYFDELNEWSEYSGYSIEFDYSQIRLEGSPIRGGFKAPGPKGINKSLDKIKNIIERRLLSAVFNTDNYANKLRPIDVYDINMHCADSVLSGGVRRCLPGYYSVELADGTWKKITDLVVGDTVSIFGGEYPITNIFNNGVQELVKVETTGGYHVSTPNHKWLCYNKTSKIVEWVEAQHIDPKNHQLVKSKNK